MCYGRANGPACVDVCPTSALIMIDPLNRDHKLGKKIDFEAADKFAQKALLGARFCEPNADLKAQGGEL